MENPSLYLYDYHVWANQRWFDHLKKLPGELWHREMTSVFPSISQVFAHIYIVDHMWFAGMSGKSFEESRVLGNRLTDEMKGISLEEMEERFAHHQMRTRHLNGHSNKERGFFSFRTNILAEILEIVWEYRLMK